MTFNPPPNWPVPPGWSPPRDWKPPPDWPSAPPGWTFWTNDTGSHIPRHRLWHRSLAIAAFVTLAVVVVGSLLLATVGTSFPGIRTLPVINTIDPTYSDPGWREPPWGPAPSACDSAAISADIGGALEVERCYGNWAYVSNGESGDGQSLLRHVDDVWTRYTGFPSTICVAQAAADGVPQAELSSFPSC